MPGHGYLGLNLSCKTHPDRTRPRVRRWRGLKSTKQRIRVGPHIAQKGKKNTKTSLEVHDAILLELRVGEGHLDGGVLPVVREPDGRAPPPPPGAQAYSNSQ